MALVVWPTVNGYDIATMHYELESFIEAAKAGDSDPFDKLVEFLNDADDLDVLLEALRHSEPVARRAAVKSAGDELHRLALERLRLLARDDDYEVRRELAIALGKRPSWGLNDLFDPLLNDEYGSVRLEAVKSARQHRTYEPKFVELLADSDWQVRQAAAWNLNEGTPPAVLPALLARLGEDGDNDVCEACAKSLEAHLNRLGTYPAHISRPKVSTVEDAKKKMESLGTSKAPKLFQWLTDRVARDVDVEKLRTFGAVLTVEAAEGRLPRAYGVEELCNEVRKLLVGDAPRAVVLLGESGAGKTALVNELAHRLLDDSDEPWHLLRVSPSELLAGTVYIGEWQTKVRDLVATVKHPRKVILYVPNLEELTTAGKSSTTTSNIASALAPHIEAGDVAILGESNPEAFREGMSGSGSLRRLFHAVEIPGADEVQTRMIVRHVADEMQADLSDSVLDRLIELASSYMVGTAQPGGAVGLLRRVINTRAGAAQALTERDLLDTLSTATGVPIDYLDDAVPLDRVKLREFFEARVMGQTEAVDSVMERVVLIKAGLTDPAKPFGVLFFVGPTGVGKTELARAMAELLFGDANRMIRLDMSEFATYDSHERLLGWANKPGLLTGPVRDQPFSLVLLDEIEKAHPNVFDLCLQMFDAGRLTDTGGKTTDFRRTLIVLTSNVGATIPDGRSVGFQPTQQPGYDPGSASREMGRWFRPEFLNRLDRIVTFRPLTAETVQQIARRELNRVLERTGITRRRLAIDVDPAVLSLLLKEGFSPSFGARPLKRTVERQVLLPVAWAVAGGEVALGSMLRLSVRAGKVHVEVLGPETDEKPTQPVEPVSQFASVSDQAASLLNRVTDLQVQSAPLSQRMAGRIAESSRSGFYSDGPGARRVLDEIYRLDSVLKRLETLTREVREQAEFAQRRRTSARDLTVIERRLNVLAGQTDHVSLLVGCEDLKQLADAFITLTRVRSQGAGFSGVARLGEMYRGLAELRGFECEILDDRIDEANQEDTLTLLITGAGAHLLLAGETGLHQFTRGQSKSREQVKLRTEREVIRVEVLPAPIDDEPFGPDVLKVDTRILHGLTGRLLARPDLELQILHRPTLLSVRAWTTGPKPKALDQLLPLVRARLQAASPDSHQMPLIRRYTLGPSPKVYDLRRGISTGRLDHVLKGHLDGLLLVKPQGDRGT